MTLLDMFHLMNPCSLGYESKKVQIVPKMTKTVIAKPFSLMMSLQIFPSLPSLHVFILDGSRSSVLFNAPRSSSHTSGTKKSNRDCTTDATQRRLHIDRTVPHSIIGPKMAPKFQLSQLSLYTALHTAYVERHHL